jgi:hypothetical protein
MANTSAIVTGVAFVTLAAINVVVMPARGFPALAQRNDENPVDRSS